MKKIKIGSIVILISMLCFLCGCEFTQKKIDEPKTIIRFATDLNQEDAGYRQLERFQKNVEELSDGTIAIQLYASEQWDSDNTLREYIEADMLEMICLSTTQLQEEVIDYQLYEYPSLFQNSLEVKSYCEKEKEQVLAYIQNNNQKGFGFVANGYYFIQQNKGPITKIEDWNGVILDGRYRDVYAKCLQQLGIGLHQTYDTLPGKSRNLTEGDLAELIAINVVNEGSYLNNPNLFYALEICIVSEKWWNQLEETQQETITEAFQKAFMKECEYQNQEDLNWVVPLGGITVQSLSNEMQEQMRTILWPTTVQYLVESQNQLGKYFYQVVELPQDDSENVANYVEERVEIRE